uniref:DUF4408 domain-containing protein n=1 Tax=Oryza glumipatula TaxID=40148 RepID=A0A0E0BSG0_9ORYZ
MEGSSSSQAKALFKATLLGLAILSMVTWVPQMYSCIKMFLVSVPSAASTLTTPRCLFIFSNIIVIFLANELKLSKGESFSESPTLTNHGSDDSIRYRVEAFTPVTKSNDVIVNHVVEEQVSTVIVHDDSLQQLDQCEQVVASSTMSMDKESRGDNNNDNLAIDVNVGDGESEELKEQGGAISQGKVIEEEMIEEEDVGLPTDELNRRVEDFIARFNMERQLEARMLVCCY